LASGLKPFNARASRFIDSDVFSHNQGCTAKKAWERAKKLAICSFIRRLEMYTGNLKKNIFSSQVTMKKHGNTVLTLSRPS